MAYKDDTKENYKKVDEKYGAKGTYIPEKKPTYSGILKVKEPEYEMKKDTTREIFTREAMPRMEDTIAQPLKRMTPVVVGDLFDRVRFLQDRISEIREIINAREGINKDIVADIENDINEKNRLVSIVSDTHERRNLKLDISILRKEKRHETVQYWKDLLELTTELRELMEQHETESKIVDIFKGMENGSKNED